MAYSVESLSKKLEEIKIGDDCFFGEDLSYEQNPLEKIEEKIEQEIPGFEISYFFRKRSMALCFDIAMMKEKIAKDLLLKIDWLMDEHFQKKNGLRELGWCSKYLLDRRSVNYLKDQEEFRKTEIVEFYWFNSSPNRVNKKTSFLPFALCNCMHFYFFMKWFFRNKNE